MLHPILKLLDMVLEIYSTFVFIYIVIQLLVHFQVVNAYQPLVAKVMRILADIIEPVLRYIRRYIKPLNNVDLSPLVLILAINFLQYTIYYYFRY